MPSYMQPRLDGIEQLEVDAGFLPCIWDSELLRQRVLELPVPRQDSARNGVSSADVVCQSSHVSWPLVGRGYTTQSVSAFCRY